MSAEQEAFAFVTNQIGQVVIILLAIIGGFRWLDKRNEKKVNDAMIKLAGDNQDGKGGIIGNIMSQYENDQKHTRSEMKNLRSRFSMVIKYLAGDVRRIDGAVERIAEKQGVYYSKSEHKYEEEDQKIQDEDNGNNDRDYSL